MKSIIQSDRNRCYYCGMYNPTEEHHIFQGRKSRQIAEDYGIKVYLCRKCHRLVHDGKNESKAMMEHLHRIGQEFFIAKYGKEEYYSKIRKSYLEDLNND